MQNDNESAIQMLLGLPNSERSRRHGNALRHNRSRRLYVSPPAVEGALSGPPGSRGMLRVGTGEMRPTGCSALPKSVGSETAREEHPTSPQLLRLSY